MYVDAKILNKTSARQIQQYLKRVTHDDQGGFILGMQGGLRLWKSRDVIHYTNNTDKEKTIWLFYLMQEKYWKKIQHWF